MDEQQGTIIGYTRVSTEEQGDSRAGLEAQKAAIRAWAARRGWHEKDLTFIEDVASGKNLRRPGIAVALDDLRRHKASTLVVAKLDRLSRSMQDFGGLMNRATKEHWALVALDVDVDTTTPQGEMQANILAVFAQFERRLIGERTRAALAEKKAAGVILGRRRTMPDDVLARILEERAAGRSTPQIAAGLNADAVPTAHGGRQWYPSTVSRVLNGAGARDLARATANAEEAKI